MSDIQRLILVVAALIASVATLIASVGLVFNGLHGRYKVPIYEDFSSAPIHSRFDTWTGRIEEKDFNGPWKEGYSKGIKGVQ